ncbi:MAG: hypothetical protein ACRDRH_20635 [Pseudonocardia sp.]
MGKQRTSNGRAAKLRRRAVRADKNRRRDSGPAAPDDLVTIGPVPDGLDLTGWHTLDDDLDDLDDAAFTGPDDALLDTSGCPVTDSCAGCGNASGLHAVTSAFGKPGGFDVACTTLCHACDGRSFLRLLDPEAFDEAFARHTGHSR